MAARPCDAMAILDYTAQAVLTAILGALVPLVKIAIGKALLGAAAFIQLLQIQASAITDNVFLANKVVGCCCKGKSNPLYRVVLVAHLWRVGISSALLLVGIAGIVVNVTSPAEDAATVFALVGAALAIVLGQMFGAYKVRVVLSTSPMRFLAN